MEKSEIKPLLEELEALRKENSELRVFIKEATKYSYIFEYASEAIFVAQDGIIKTANPALEKLSGYSLSELIAKPFVEFIHPDDREMVLEKHLAIIKGQIPETEKYEFRVIHKTGKVLFVELKTNLIQWEGTPAILNFLIDITERRDLEERLKQSEEKYRTIFEKANEAIIIVRGTTIELANPAAERIAERSKEVLTSEPFVNFIHPEDREMVLENHLRRMRGEKVKNEYDFRIITPDGKVKWVYNKPQIVTWEGEKANLTLLTDITDRKLLEEELRLERDQLLSIFNSIEEIIYVSDPYTYEVLYANSFLVKKIGEDPVGKKCYEIFQGRNSPCPFCTNEIILKDRGKPYYWEYYNPKLNTYVAIADRIIRWPDGRDVRLEFAIDITERKRMEESLKLSEANFRSFVESMHDMVGVWTMEGKILYANDAFMKRLGYTLEELEGLSYYNFHPSDLRKEAEEIFAEILRGDRTTYPLPLKTKDGNIIPAETRITFGKWNGKDCIFSISKDITAEQEALQLWEKLFKNNPVSMAILTLQPDKRFIDVNITFLETFGYTRGEVVGKTPGEIGLFLNPKECENILATFSKEGRARELEIEIKAKDGSIRNVLLSAEKIVSQNRQYLLVVMVDITEIRRLEEERKKLQEALFQSQKLESIGRLAGGIAHDFNNILEAILGFTELSMNELDPSSPVFKYLKNIQEAGKCSKGIIKQLLGFARKQVISPKVINPNDVIINMFGLLRQLIGEHINIELSLEGNLWPVYIDPTQLYQLILNLSLNARDAITSTGNITISTANITIEGSSDAPSIKPGDYVMISVSDDGFGMDEETLKYIFEPFFTTKGKGKGTGIGLSAVYDIVNQNGGFIDVSSKLGVGTTFKIYLPRFFGEQVKEEVAEKRFEAPKGKGETILVVEDELSLLEIIKTALKSGGYKVIATVNPREAINIVAEGKEKIDLLITDLSMPEMDGLELINRLEAIRPGIKYLIMSGYAFGTIAKKAKNIPIIEKPFSLKDFYGKIRDILER